MRKPLNCHICNAQVDKAQAEFVDEETFAFYVKSPVSLGVYCYSCFDQKVQPELSSYQEKMELAKSVNVFFASQSKESRFVRRIEKPVQVSGCVDRDEALLRLAFKAVEAGKNALVDVDIKSEKIVNGKWQTSRWSGRAIPADISEAQLNRKFIGAPN